MPSCTETAPPLHRTRPGPVPWIAMYHSVGDCSDDPYRITVSPDRLERQLRWLRRQGLRGVSVSELLAQTETAPAQCLQREIGCFSTDRKLCHLCEGSAVAAV